MCKGDVEVTFFEVDGQLQHQPEDAVIVASHHVKDAAMQTTINISTLTAYTALLFQSTQK